MKCLHVVLIGLLLNQSCHPRKVPASFSFLPVLSMPADSLPWVSYQVNGLVRDTTLFGKPQKTGTLTDPSLEEVSGLALSRQNPGYLWVQEDSGNSNQIQLITPQGTLVGSFTLTGLQNRDWEDIVVGPGPVPGQNYVYLAEIGDNRYRYPYKFIYRFPEPTLADRKRPVRASITQVETITLYLPDGPRNAEAILLDPTSRDLYLLSKGSACLVYKAAYPQSVTQPILMQRLLALPIIDVTSAGISPDGHEILVRNYKQLFYFRRRADESVADAFRQKPRLVSLALEAQGEAIGWLPDGSGYYTTSEKVEDYIPQAINLHRRRP